MANTKTKAILLRFPDPALHKHLIRLAEKNDRSVTGEILTAIKKHLKEVA